MDKEEFFTAIRENNLKNVKRLSKSANNSIKTNGLAIALEFVVKEPEYIDIIKYLVKNGANIFANDWEGTPNYPIRFAAYIGHLDLLKFFIKQNPEKKKILVDQIFKSALTSNYASKRYDIMEYALENGANIHGLVNKNTFIKYSIVNNDIDMVRFLISYGAFLPLEYDNYIAISNKMFPNHNIEMINLLNSTYSQYLVEDKADKECAICLDPETDSKMIKTKCGHHFDKKCLKEWRKTSNKCPMCRSQNTFFGKIKRKSKKTSKRKTSKRKPKKTSKRKPKKTSKRM